MKTQIESLNIANNLNYRVKIMSFLRQLNQTMEELGNAASAARRG